MKLAIGLVAAALATADGGCSRTGLLDGDPTPDRLTFQLPKACAAHALSLSIEEQIPNLYFVLDRSGSMSESMPGGSGTKWSEVHKAVVALARSIGEHARFGATVFPAASGICDAGQEVFTTTRGDPTPAAGAADGAHLTALDKAIDVTTLGYTPTAGTLRALLPKLSGLPGHTVIVLATDGGPNCNDHADCGPRQCISNIQGAPGCSDANNCCAPSAGPYAELMCLDSGPTMEAVTALRSAGIPTYVIGIPGSQPFTDLLEDLSSAGGTAKSTSPKYYAVDDVNAMQQVLQHIGGDVVACDFTMASPPADPGSVRVFLDGEEVGLGANDGWLWTSATSFRLLGRACQLYLRGGVQHVDALEGCDRTSPGVP